MNGPTIIVDASGVMSGLASSADTFTFMSVDG